MLHKSSFSWSHDIGNPVKSIKLLCMHIVLEAITTYLPVYMYFPYTPIYLYFPLHKFDWNSVFANENLILKHHQYRNCYHLQISQGEQYWQMVQYLERFFSSKNNQLGKVVFKFSLFHSVNYENLGVIAHHKQWHLNLHCLQKGQIWP